MRNATKNVFERKEKKYIITRDQMDQLLALVSDHISPDRFFESNIASTYYDMPDYSVIEHSLSKPKFKEKLRVRSYGNGTLFVELKKKYNGIVYKRRLEMCEDAARAWMAGDAFDNVVSKYGMPYGEEPSYCDKQTAREIDVYRNRHAGLSPAMNIYAHRFSYAENGDDDGARITFDTELYYEDLRALKTTRPVKLTEMVVMETKVHDAYPLWLSHALAELEIYPQSFSKYGTAYRELQGTFSQAKTRKDLPVVDVRPIIYMAFCKAQGA